MMDLLLLGLVVLNLLYLVTKLNKLERIERRIMSIADDILADVQEESSLDDSIINLLTNIKAQLDAAGTDAAKLAAIKDAIDANKAKISAAIVANTPAAPAP